LNVIVAKNIKEIETCFKLRENIFIKGQNVPLDREKDEYDSMATHFLLFYEQIPIGVARIVRDGSTAVVGRLGVLNEYRGKKFGYFLMDEIIGYCKQNNFQKILLGAQEHAINIWMRIFPILKCS
jgi:predicted GNAT family N-acyltransferase